MAIFGSSSHRSLKRLYAEADISWQRGNFVAAIESASHALDLLNRGIDWPLKAEITNEKYVFPANLLLIRAKCEVALSQRDHRPVDGNTAQRLCNDLMQAIDLCDQQPGAFPTYVNATLELADLCTFCRSRLETQSVSFALKHLRVVQNASKSNDALMYAGALGREADLLQKYFTAEPQTAHRSIACLTEALSIFESLNDSDMIFTSKSRLARYHLHPLMLQDAHNIEKSLSYAYSAIDNQPDDPGMERYLILDVIGRAHSIRKNGNPMTNLVVALGAFETVLNDFTDEENAEHWPELVLFWVDKLLSSEILDGNEEQAKALLDYSYSVTYGGEQPDLLSLAQHRLEAVIERIHSLRDPYNAFSALKTQFRLSKLNATKSLARSAYIHSLRSLQESINKEVHTDLWVDLDWEITLIDLDTDSPESLRMCAERLSDVLVSHDFTSRPIALFETRLLIANCLIALGEWEGAYEYVSALMAEVFSQIEGDFKGYSQKLYALPGGPDRSRDIPIVAVKSGDVASALAYLDINTVARLAFDLELLLIIDTQVNRRALMQTYIHVKQGQRVMHSSSGKDFLIEALRLEQLQASLEAKRMATPEYLRSLAFNDLNRWLAKLDCWVFVPVIGSRISKFLLIPPQSSTAEIICSSDQQIGYLDLLGRLTSGESHSGWITIQPKLVAEATDETIDAIEHEFEEMRRYLWPTFAAWITQTIDKHEKSNVEQLCIIASGPLSLFPFGMAFDEQSESYLLDRFSIQHAPSLYALLSIKERLKHYRERPSFGAVTGKSHDELPFVPFGAEFGAAHFDDGRSQVVSGESYKLTDVIQSLRQANHWQFSGHAGFHWKDPSLSALELSDGELPVDLIEAIVSDSPIRLVMLSACSTALEETLEKDVERYGFSNKFLSLGALGVIVSLWPQQDEASAFITERFYYYYQTEKLSPVDALRRAQLWLRDVTYAELFEYLEDRGATLPHFEELIRRYIDVYGDRDRDMRPFEDPEYWAGFILIGT